MTQIQLPVQLSQASHLQLAFITPFPPPTFTDLAPVVRRLDNVIHWINSNQWITPYILLSLICQIAIYLLNSIIHPFYNWALTKGNSLSWVTSTQVSIIGSVHNLYLGPCLLYINAQREVGLPLPENDFGCCLLFLLCTFHPLQHQRTS